MEDYDDIIDLPHYEPRHHARMTMAARAAQFAPFAAVAGHDEAIREEGRVTDAWLAPGEWADGVLNRKVTWLLARLDERPAVTVEHFVADAYKAGGAYITTEDNVKRINELARTMELTDGTVIHLDNIRDITIG